MPPKLRFYPQERSYTCVPACVRMVIARWGTEVSEDDLCHCCKTDFLGTTAIAAAECAQSLGYQAETYRDATWETLKNWLDRGLYPILFVNLFPLESLWVYHAVVVEEIADDRVIYLDPAQGRRAVTASAFEQAWQLNKRQAIIIQS